jgi:hypothetical protein
VTRRPDHPKNLLLDRPTSCVVRIAMGWRDLLFQNWPVDPAVLDPHLPAGLEPDTYDGAAWLTLVPFINVAVRPAGVPERVGVAFPELNLRTYVAPDGVPGVYFLSLDAASLGVVLAGRAAYHLPYYYAAVRLNRRSETVAFESRRRHPGATPVRYRARYRPTGAEFRATEDPLATFLTERYRFYADAGESLRYTDVEHDVWTLAPAAADVETNTLFSAAGLARPGTDPVTYYSGGADVVTAGTDRS